MKTLHMIGNAHIDPVWLWPWQEGFQEVKATFRSALDRMAEYDDFIFTCSSAAIYEWVERSDPEMFEEIRRRVREGRWVIVGGWWVQPDCNIPGGESFVRQALLGQRYFYEKFGVTAKVGYNVDSFGHHGMLPQILRKSGMDAYVFMRPMPHEKTLPGPLFWWESDDGSRVLTFRILYAYETWGKDLESRVRRHAEHLLEPLDELMMFYGVGNHGGGPTKENIESIRALNGQPELPRLVMSSPNRFFAELVEKGRTFPVVHDDLQHHASGCYSAHAGVKQWNRRAENKLLVAEAFSSIAAWAAGQPYPADYKRAWKSVLFNQFHDTLAGTSIEEAYEDARNEFGEAMAIADRGLNEAVQSLSWKVDVPAEEGMRPLVVFNPHSWEAKVPVTAELSGIGTDPVVVDEAGRELAVQISPPSSTTADINRRYRFTFVDTLPSLGYRTYRVYPDRKQAPAARISEAVDSQLAAGDSYADNGRFRLELDPETGWIRSLRDQAKSFELFAGPAAQPAVIADDSDTWSHGVRRFDRAVGHFAAVRVCLLETGTVKATLRAISEYGRSRLIQDFTLYRDLNRIDVKVELDWREQFRLLKLLFPVNLRGFRPTYEIPYGHIVREADGDEEPGQSWVDYSGIAAADDSSYGISLLNDGKYSFSMDRHVLGLTVLRSPIYAHHEPVVPDPERQYSFMDQGVHRFGYALYPHAGGWERAGTVRQALEFNRPPVVVAETYHAGALPQRQSYLAIDADHIVACALKEAEDGGDLILRCRETIKKAGRATVRLPVWGRVFEAEFGPCEIKTFRVPKDPALPVTETDLTEWPID